MVKNKSFASLIMERERIIADRRRLARDLKDQPDALRKYAQWVKPMDVRLMEINKVLEL